MRGELRESLTFLRSSPVRIILVMWFVTIVAAVICTIPFGFWTYVVAADHYPGLRYPTPARFGWTYLIGVVAGVALATLVLAAGGVIIDRGVRDDERRARFRVVSRWVALVLATGMAVIPLMFVLIPNLLGGVLLAVPGAVMAVWVIHRVQRYRRIPLKYGIAAVGWGVTFAFTTGHHFLAFIHIGLARVAVDDPIPDGADPRWHATRLLAHPTVVLAAPIWEELAKGAGVLVILCLIRHRFDGAVSGFVIGAMVGIGFNFIETARYAMTSFDAAIYQVWVRQWVSGIAFGHVLFTGLTGAALGLAVTKSGRAAKAALVAAGFVIAVLGHFVWNYAAFNRALPWQGGSATAETVINFPLNYLTLSGPFLLLLVVVVWIGLCKEGQALRSTLRIEASTGADAISPVEAMVLARPGLRLVQRILAVRSLGPMAYIRLGRLHAAQLDLAMERWRLAHDRDRVPPESEAALRQRIAYLREELLRRANKEATWAGA